MYVENIQRHNKLYAFTYQQIYIHLNIHTYIQTYIHKHTYIDTYIHTYIHIHTHTPPITKENCLIIRKDKSIETHKP